MEIVVLSIGVVAAASAVVFVTWSGRGTWIGRRIGRRVILHLTDDRSIEGTLMTTSKDGVILRGAKYLESGTDLAGEVYVPRERLSFGQVRDD